jgi:hypothetical protein
MRATWAPNHRYASTDVRQRLRTPLCMPRVAAGLVAPQSTGLILKWKGHDAACTALLALDNVPGEQHAS